MIHIEDSTLTDKEISQSNGIGCIQSSHCGYKNSNINMSDSQQEAVDLKCHIDINSGETENNPGSLKEELCKLNLTYSAGLPLQPDEGHSSVCQNHQSQMIGDYMEWFNTESASHLESDVNSNGILSNSAMANVV